MTKVVLIIGGNLGDVKNNIAKTAERIGQLIGRVTAASSIMESEAWGFKSEDVFFNQVLVVESALTAEDILNKCLQIENELGRVRNSEAGYVSRTMDIDILFYGNEVIDTPLLTVPHPLISQRKFVLEPLAEVIPNFIHPQSGKSMAQLLEAFV